MEDLKVTDIQIKETGILFGLIGIVSGLYSSEEIWFFLAAGILVITLVIPVFLKPLALIWFGFSKGLGWVTSRILLLVVFLVLVTPMGMVRRFIGRDSLQLHKFKKGKKSSFIERNHEYAALDFKYPF
jgi:hypothetical protein